jgi:hypothetical protein
MKNPAHTILRIAAVLALTVSATTAIAQERRGYDDNERVVVVERGDRFDRNDRDERRGPPGWARVRVEEARYGARGQMCDARRSVRDQVERNRGAIRVGNNLCGDPARGAQKRLSVVYRCGGGESVRVVARENETLRLSCRR